MHIKTVILLRNFSFVFINFDNLSTTFYIQRFLTFLFFHKKRVFNVFLFLGSTFFTSMIGIGSGILDFRPCWCPSPFPSPSIFQCFSIHSSYLPLDFVHLFFMVAVSAPRHQPSSFTRAWDPHRTTVDPDIVTGGDRTKW